MNNYQEKSYLDKQSSKVDGGQRITERIWLRPNSSLRSELQIRSNR